MISIAMCAASPGRNDMGTYEQSEVLAVAGKGFPGVSANDSTCMNSSICFFTRPQRLIAGSVTNSHVHNILSKCTR